MSSPFPGMDPFIESQAWEDFHHHLIEGISASLVPQVRPRYVVRVEKRVYVENRPNGSSRTIRPDVAVLERAGGAPVWTREGGTATLEAPSPLILTLPMPEEEHEAYVTIRDGDSMAVVTVIEVVSPTNKAPESDGQREYLRKRGEVIRADTNLVELDLLRGGERLPVVEPLPLADYFAFVARAARRPAVEVFHWTLRQPFPDLPVPLAGQDADAVVQLHSVFAAGYDRGGYDYSLDYDRLVDPPLSDADAEWVAARLQGWRPARA